MISSLPAVFTLAAAIGVLSSALTLSLIRLNAFLRWSAIPRGDRWHTRATPNSGGVAIFLSCAVCYLFAFRGAYPSVALGAIAMFALGFLDDRLRLPALPKFLAQCSIAAAVVAGGVVFPATPWFAVNWFFSFLWIVGITNSFNLIDNMDGLCAGVTVVICAFRAFALSVSGDTLDAALAAMLAAAFAGFLCFNYHPARIFLGDCGSMLGGFLLAALTIASSQANTKAFAAGFFYPALTFTYPIFDTVLVSVLRRSAGRPISVGGRDHSSHRLAYLGIPEQRVVWILWGLTALGSAVGLMTRWMPLEVIAAAALLTAALCMFAIFLSTLPPYQIPKDSPVLGSRLRRHVPTLRAGVILIVDGLLAGTAFLIAFLVRYGSNLGATNLGSAQVRGLFLSLPLVIVCQGIASCLSRTFEISWKWFIYRDSVRVGSSVLGGAALVWAALRYPPDLMLLYCGLCLAMVTGLRASLSALHELFEPSTPGRERVGILGVGEEGAMLANLLKQQSSLNVTPVLFLDYDRAKHGMRVHGIPVRCYESNLRDLANQFRFQSVLIAGPFDRERHAELTRDCLAAGLRACALDIAIRELDSVRPLAAAAGD
jgi:UDP-GlcNAc:undecaprenyl-phosphate GlcNAc-1-phosphate transferase